MPDLVPLIPNLALMILLYSLGHIFISNALKLGEASDFTILFASRALWTISAAILFLKESSTLTQVISTTLIIASAIIMTSKTKILHPAKSHFFLPFLVRHQAPRPAWDLRLKRHDKVGGVVKLNGLCPRCRRRRVVVDEIVR